MTLFILLGISVLLALLVGVAYTIWYHDDGYHWGLAIFPGLGMTAVSGAALGLLSLLIVLAISLTLPSTSVDSHRQDLKALGNSSNISGSFFLGSGYIGSSQYFNYIVKQDNGGYKLDSVYAEAVTVFEDAPADSGWYITYTAQKDYDWLVPFSLDGFDAPDPEFHIPEGSIVTGYNVSVE